MLVLGLLGCEADASSTAVTRAPIIGGVVAPEDDAIVVVSHVEVGELCSGTLVSKRVVVTAKHCTFGAAQDGVAIGFGDTVDEARSATVFSREHRATPGMVIDGQDVAVVMLREDAPIAPLPWVREGDARSLLGRTLRVVGFGLDELGVVGVRRSVEDRVIETGGAELATEGPSGCEGDSGGAALDESGALVGVVARGRAGCRDRVIFGIVSFWRELVEGAIADSGECVEAPETCNAIDDDCDGEIDEGCASFGEPCESDGGCTIGTCRETVVGPICTTACDAARTLTGCPEGFYCAGESCDGSCVAGDVGAMRNGQTCARDTDCASLRCRAIGPSDPPTCVDACERGVGHCVAGLVCAPTTGSTCGSCVAPERGPSTRELGEPCDGAAECAAAACEEGECTRACDDGDATCPVGFQCRATSSGMVCLRRAPEAVGVPCALDADCESEICGFVRDRRFCTSICDEDEPCPEGTACAPADEGLNACVPERSTLGEPCASDADCLFGACARVGSQGACTRPCVAEMPCPAGFSCVPAADGTPICLRPDTFRTDDGCGCAVGRGSTHRLCVLVVLFILAPTLLGRAARRRRR